MRLQFSLMLLTLAAVSTGAESKPNFSGVWKLLSGDRPQIIVIDQSETELRVFQFIADRLITCNGPIDGQTHSHIADDYSCDFLARWEGNSLLMETGIPNDLTSHALVHIQRLMSLAADGWTMSVTRTNVTPQPGEVREKWQRQDPPAQVTFVSGFDDLRKLDSHSAGMTAAEESHLHGRVATAFNDVAQAEQALLAVIDQRPASRLRDEARGNLAAVYARNGLFRKALPYCSPGDRAFYKQLVKYPETSVTHRGYAHVQMTRDPEGRLMLPVSAAGKDARYMVDTGTNMSLLQMSEAVRLGLKLEHVHRLVGDGNVSYDGILAIVPALTLGATRLENVPFLVVPDERCEWSGIIGIDLLLKVETLRWNANGDGEIGFPAQQKDIRNANLCFAGDYPLVDISFQGQGHSVLFLDTGNNSARFFPPFAIRHLGLVTANGKRFVEPWHAQGAEGEISELTFPEIILSISGVDMTLRPANVLLERPSVNDKLEGTIGMDLLNTAQRVTLDFQAMRLTLE